MNRVAGESTVPRDKWYLCATACASPDPFPLDGGRLATVIAGQAICGFQVVSSRRIAFSMVSILRMHAVSATFLGLPRSTSRR